MYSRWFHEVEGDLRNEMKGLRWLLIREQDLVNATSAWMFAELDGTLIAIDHRGSEFKSCLLYTSPSPRDKRQSRMPSSA